MANIETLLADTRYYAEVAAPGTPAAGSGVTYVKTDGKLYFKNDAGAETDLTLGGSAGATLSTLGTTSAGASFATARGVYVKKITVASAGLIPSIVAFIKSDASHYVGFNAMLYSDVAGAPVNLLAVGGPSTDTGPTIGMAHAILNATVRAITVPLGFVASATDYWIGINIQGGVASSIALAFNSGTGGDKTQLSGGDAPKDSSVAAFSATSNDYCIYANVIR